MIRPDEVVGFDAGHGDLLTLGEFDTKERPMFTVAFQKDMCGVFRKGCVAGTAGRSIGRKKRKF